MTDNEGRFGLERRPFLKLAGAAGGSTLFASTTVAKDEEDGDKKETYDTGEEDPEKPHIHIVGHGGTIANVTGEYSEPSDFIYISEVVEQVPELAEVANITTTNLSRQGSGGFTVQNWYDTYDEIMSMAESDDPPDGYVVTQGSNTSEETAWFLNLTLDTDAPVMVTAAQRGIGTLGAEGFKNLYDAVRVAGSEDAKGRGVLLVANNEIHHSREVFKTASPRPNGWESPFFGPLGITNGEIEFYRESDRLSTTDTEFDISSTTPDDYPLENIHIVFSAVAVDGQLTEAAIESGTEGIIVAGFLTGNAANPNQTGALDEATSQGIPVVMSTRGTQARVTTDGPEIGADTLTPHKARILLALGLMETSDRDALQEMFNKY